MQDEQEITQSKAECFIQQQSAETISVEERLTSCLGFMKECLAQEKSPDFKAFWQVRQFCFPLFKEPLNKHTRSNLWSQYTELTREGRRLKSLLDVESSFAAQQINLAIEDVEAQIAGALEDHDQVVGDFQVPKFPQALKQVKDAYCDAQGRLQLFNVFASRIHALRKELIRTQMRMKQKNGLFAKLSCLGDQVFPLRKELMKTVNEAFVNDVDQFAERHFSENNFAPEKVRKQVFFYRDEIKLFQTLAKALTLDTHSFAHTRSTLSKCWDQLKGMEKELKKEFSEQKQQSSENAEKLKADIEQVTKAFEAGELLLDQVEPKLEAIAQEMRKTTLVRGDVQMLKGLLNDAYKPLNDKRDEQKRARQEQEAQAEAKRKETIQAFEDKIATFIASIEQGDMAALTEQQESLREEYRSLPASTHEKMRMDASFKTIRDRLMARQEARLLELPAESRQLLDELSQLLEQRKLRRSEIKAQLDEYRKVLAGSSLDIEKAMSTQELMAQEKEALEQCDASILEIENKIKDLKT